MHPCPTSLSGPGRRERPPMALPKIYEKNATTVQSVQMASIHQ
jgi:hypothetical protein